jgi:protein TonB
MLFLIYYVISTTQDDHNINAVYDSVVHYIIEGKLDTAITIAKQVLERNSRDFLLLGLMHYARDIDMISNKDLPNSWEYLMSYPGKEEMPKAWEKVCRKYPDSKKVYEIMVSLLMYTDEDKAQHYAEKILEIDSLDAIGYFLNGYFNERSGAIEKALSFYYRAYVIDTLSHDCLCAIAHLHIANGNLDSAIYYLQKLPCDDSTCHNAHLIEAALALKMGDTTLARLILDSLKTNAAGDTIMQKVSDIENYIHNMADSSYMRADSIIVPLYMHFYGLKYCGTSMSLIAVFSLESSEIVNCDTCERFQSKPPLAIRKPIPIYPEEGRIKGMEGVVMVKALLDVDGSVVEAEIYMSSLPEVFEDAVLKAARAAKFTPGTKYGHPIKVWISIPYTFKLN